MADVIKAQRHNERQLLANISHELRSPLTRISVATDLLDRRYKEDEIVEISLRLGKEVARMNDMISLLLEQAKDKVLSLGESGVVSISDILRELTDDFAFQGEIASKGVYHRSNTEHHRVISARLADSDCGYFCYGDNSVCLEKVTRVLTQNGETFR